MFQLLYKKNAIAKAVSDWYEVDLNSLTTLIKEPAQFIISEESIKETEDNVSTLIDSFVTFLSHPREGFEGGLYDLNAAKSRVSGTRRR
ncbi:MAG: hypothetical protein V1894_00790 [Chloroflexota bacterium]